MAGDDIGLQASCYRIIAKLLAYNSCCEVSVIHTEKYFSSFEAGHLCQKLQLQMNEMHINKQFSRTRWASPLSKIYFITYSVYYVSVMVSFIRGGI